MVATVSLRGAINAKCKDCIYDPLSGLGAWREQVEGCTSYNCPLYPYRPTSKRRSAHGDGKSTVPRGNLGRFLQRTRP